MAEKAYLEVKSPHNDRGCPSLIRQSSWWTALISQRDRNGPSPPSLCQLIHTGENPESLSGVHQLHIEDKAIEMVGGVSGELPTQSAGLRTSCVYLIWDLIIFNLLFISAFFWSSATMQRESFTDCDEAFQAHSSCLKAFRWPLKWILNPIHKLAFLHLSSLVLKSICFWMGLWLDGGSYQVAKWDCRGCRGALNVIATHCTPHRLINLWYASVGGVVVISPLIISDVSFKWLFMVSDKQKNPIYKKLIYAYVCASNVFKSSFVQHVSSHDPSDLSCESL